MRESVTTLLSDGGLPDLPRAACKGRTDDIFFPATSSSSRALTPQAKAICAGCPEREPCLAWALGHRVVGVWGGLTDDERREMLGPGWVACRTCGELFRGRPRNRCETCADGPAVVVVEA